MFKKTVVFALGILLAGCAADRSQLSFATASADAPEAEIYFVRHGGIYDFHPVSDRVVYLQSRHRDWYQVTMFGTCPGLRFAMGARFLPSIGGDSFDRFSSIRFEHQNCKVESVKAVPPPDRVTGPGLATHAG